jgi:hypothetical protein
MNKLTIEEQFLTLDQAKELQDLGVDIYGNFEIDIDDNGFESNRESRNICIRYV